MAKNDEGPVLVVGAMGALGRALVDEARARGQAIRTIVRSSAALPDPWAYFGDATDQDFVLKTAEGCRAIVNATGAPVGLWRRTLPEINARLVAGACAENCPIVGFSPSFVFGERFERPMEEHDELRPKSPLAQVRWEIEQSLRSATKTGECRAVLVRASDLFGPTVRSGPAEWTFAHAKAGLPMRWPGAPDAPHQWSYAPDVARLVFDLLDRRPTGRHFEVVHHAGHLVDSQREFARSVAEAAGRPDLPLTTSPRWALKFSGLFDQNVFAMVDRAPHFHEALVLDDPRRRELLPEFANAPLERAVRETLEALPAGEERPS